MIAFTERWVITMKKAFLSHSSVDKPYVRVVVDRLGVDKCIFDEYTFEDGMETLDEIYKGLDESDVFVFFISDNSLNSEWVEKERNFAKILHDRGSLLRIYPIIIDPKITHKDVRIPSWMKEKYNIRFIGSPKIAANKIRARMREISWGQDDVLKRKNNLFVGRNGQIASFEKRRSDFDEPDLQCIVASSAFEGIGRKAFMSHVLKKGNLMEWSYEYNLITLERNESIEDFILKISDLGQGRDDIGILLPGMSFDEKIQEAVSVIKEIQRHNEYIFINDYGVIIKPNRKMADWFSRILGLIDSKIVFGIASVYCFRDTYRNRTVFATQIPELESQEIGLLLKDFSLLSGLDLSKDNLKAVANVLTGYPEQVFYAVHMIKNDGIGKTLNRLYEIKAYSDDKSQVILDRFVDTDNKREFLVFLSSFDFVSYDILDKVFANNFEYKNYLDLFLSVSICELMGADGEYVRVNNVIRDIVFRQKLCMGDKLEGLFKEIANHTVDDEFISNSDLPTYYTVLKEKVISGDIDERYIIPSVYLKSIVSQYNSRRYDKASFLCKKVISSDRTSFYDNEVLHETYYYYCLSLAREHNRKDFFDAVDSPLFNEEDRQFLKGFYFRISGKPNLAIEHLKKALHIRGNMPKARRELANAYITSEDYESAEKLCVENYHEDDKNPYYIQPYFETVLHKYIGLNKPSSLREDDALEKRRCIDILKSLLDSMKGNRSDQAKQMYICMRAEYEAFVNEDYAKALSIITDGEGNVGNADIYLFLSLFDIAYRFKDSSTMKKAMDKIDAIVSNQRYFSNAMNIRKIRFTAMNGDKEGAISLMRQLKSLPKGFVEKIQNEVEEITR